MNSRGQALCLSSGGPGEQADGALIVLVLVIMGPGMSHQGHVHLCLLGVQQAGGMTGESGRLGTQTQATGCMACSSELCQGSHQAGGKCQRSREMLLVSQWKSGVDQWEGIAWVQLWG